MTDVVRIVAQLEEAVDLHAARLLLLINAFAGKEGKDQIRGLTKLAKLDFLLRYPVMLERALEARRKTTRDVKLQEHERSSVESEMVRYRFGPWDHRYRQFINVLIAKQLVEVGFDGRTVVIGVTRAGKDAAERLAVDPLFEPYQRRAIVLKRHIDLTATNLMRFIYETFPEIVSLRSNERITA